MDLVSLNVQRGRDHGIAPYNIWRTQCGLTRFERWSDMIVVASPETIDHLSSVYENVNDVDLVIGYLFFNKECELSLKSSFSALIFAI